MHFEFGSIPVQIPQFKIRNSKFIFHLLGAGSFPLCGAYHAPYSSFMPASSVTIIYASTSGHTEYVVERLVALLQERAPQISVRVLRAESAGPEDLTSADVLVLGSGTWHMFGQEGQLNERMHRLLFDRCTGVDLSRTPVALISLGDDRYHFTARCTEHFMRFLKDHGGKTFLLPLIIVNEPYGQEERIVKWGEKFMEKMV